MPLKFNPLTGQLDLVPADQTLSINGRVITISGANGNTITLPGGGEGGNVILDENGYISGADDNIKGVIIEDSDGNLKLARMDPDGAWNTSTYYGGALPLDAILSEDGTKFMVTEDSLSYVSQES